VERGLRRWVEHRFSGAFPGPHSRPALAAEVGQFQLPQALKREPRIAALDGRLKASSTQKLRFAITRKS